MRRHLLTLCVIAALAACGEAPQAPAPETPTEAAAPATASTKTQFSHEQLAQLFDEYWEASLELNPLRATFVGDTRYNDRLPNFLSQEHMDRALAFEKDWLTRIEAVDTASLSESDRISVEIFRRDRGMSIEGDRFPGELIPINQFYNMANLAVMLGSGTGAQPFKTLEDYDKWLARGARLPVLFDQAIANMRRGIEQGVVQPRVLMEKVIPQLEAHIVEDAEKSLFWRPVANPPEGMGEQDLERLRGAYRTMILEQLVPAYTRLRDFIRDEYIPNSRTSVGLSALPEGEAWYAFNVRNITTTDMTPAQIHEIGLAEVERIHGEMRQVMEEVGFEGSLQDFFVHMTTDPKFTFESEEALLAAYRGFHERVQAGVPALFSLTPRAGFEIRPVEAYRAASAAGGSYMSPSEDGTRAGVFYVNTYDLPVRKTWDMEALFLHEAIPGHHFQIALKQELTDLPRFRRFGGETAFAEGWGLYAESLGKELGVYTDPYQWFGRLQAELWRAIRLVVDTGLHSKAWTREQVIEYMLQNSATTQTEAVSETERYIAIPGQALAYKIGELKIQELRDRAEAELGEAFDIRQFHAQVLNTGSLPLDVLEAKIDRWIAQQKKGGAPES
ncbi:MAG TPA: DUF885 domain-containing protein [Xanthomonadaceae bacterium]|nr:DUF885 domain-containing protein [Xanthomonadaceae bacterium]